MSLRAIVRSRTAQGWQYDLPALEESLNRCRALRRSDPATLLQVASDTIGKAAQGGFHDAHIEALLFCAEASHRLGDHAAMREYLARTEELLPLSDNPRHRLSFYHSWGLHYLDLGEFQTAHDYFTRTLELSERVEDDQAGYNALNSFGLLFARLGDYDTALRFYFDSLEGVYQAHDHDILPSLLTNIGTAYMLIGDFAKGLDYYDQSLRIRSALNDTIGVAITLRNIAGIYRRQGKFECAIENFEQALAIWQQIGNKKKEANILANMGLTYADLGDLPRAIAATQKSLRYARQTRDTLEYALALSKLGGIYQMGEEYEKAQTSLTESLLIFQRLGMREYEFIVHRHLGEVYEACGEYEKGLDHYKQYMVIREEVRGVKTQRSVANAEIRQALLKSEGEKELLRVRAEGAQKEVEFKTKELNTMTLHMTQQEEMLKKVREEMQPLLRTGEEGIRKNAMQILRQIESVVEKEEKWNVFQEQFEQVYHEFIAQLRSMCADLTPTEIRICVLIKLNLSTKQIADMLFASPLTVKTHRTHIRRKLGLEEGVNLSSLLLSM